MSARPTLMSQRWSAARLIAATVAGLLAAAVAWAGIGRSYAPVLGWIVAAGVFLAWTWSVIGGMDARRTAEHATREDPSRAGSDLILIAASLSSLGGVAWLLVEHGSGGTTPAGVTALLGLGSVAASWLTVHTLYTVRYASMYYGGTVGGIGFNQTEPPRYLDFAYLAFSLGMTYQVSDTDLQTSVIRATALRHSLLSFIFGAVILATTINLVAGLGA